jgi:hypothetical protein
MSLGVYRGPALGGPKERVITLNIQAAEEGWVNEGTLLTPRYDFSGAEHKGKIYTFDGRGANGNHISGTEAYDLQTQKSNPISHHPGKYVMGYGCASDGDDGIYSFGGINNYGGNTGWLFKYNVSTDTYTDENDMPFNAASPCVVKINDTEILVANGNSIYTFNFKTKAWTLQKTQQLVNLSGPIALLYDNKVYFVKSGAIYVYDIENKTFDIVTDELQNRNGAYIYIIGSKIYSSGGADGYNTNTLLNTTDGYDIDTSQLISGIPILSSKQKGLAISMDNEAFIFGGFPITGSIDKYTSGNTGKNTLDIINDSVVNLTQEFSYNNELKTANTNHQLTGPGVLKLLSGTTTGTIKEQIKNITLTNL